MTYRRATGLGYTAIFLLVGGLAVACGDDDATAPVVTNDPDAGSSASDDGGGGQNDVDAGDGGPSAESITVNGKVVFATINVKGVKIVINGQTATTADNGSFSIGGVVAPYTAYVIVPKELVLQGIGAPKDAAAVYAFYNLTNENPVFNVPAKSNAVTARVKGVVLGGTNDAKYSYRVIAASLQTAYQYQDGDFGGGPSNSAKKDYQLTEAWSAGQSQQFLNMSAVEFKMPEGLPFGQGIPFVWSSTSHSTIQLTAAGESDGNLGTFKAVATKEISGGFTIPTGYVVSSQFLHLLGNGNDELQFTEDKTAIDFDYVVPDDKEAFPKVRVGAEASGGALGQYSRAWADVLPATKDIKIALRAGPTLSKPTDNQAGVKAGDTLEWTSAGDECLYTVTLNSQTDGATYFSLRTTSTSVPIPDLASYGAALGASSSYSYFVECSVLDAKADLDDEVVLGGAAYHGLANGALKHFLTK